MAAKQDTRRERLSTDVVLQLLLDERSECESESDSVSQYREFVGEVLTDSDGDVEGSFADDEDVCSRQGQSGEEEAHEWTEEERNDIGQNMELSENAASPTQATKSELPSTSKDCETGEHLPLDPFASSDSQAEEEELTILEPPMSGSGESCAEEMDSEDDGDGNGDDDDDECLSGESVDISSDEAQATNFSTSRHSRRRWHSGRRGGVGRAFRGVGSRNVRTRIGRARQKDSFLSFIPDGAKKIEEIDAAFVKPMDFHPNRQPGPQIPLQGKTPLDIFQLFFDNEVLEHLVASTNAYAELKKAQKPKSYQRFMLHKLTKEEMLRYIGVLLLLSVNSVRSYRQAWNPKSSQVRILSMM